MATSPTVVANVCVLDYLNEEPGFSACIINVYAAHISHHNNQEVSISTLELSKKNGPRFQYFSFIQLPLKRALAFKPAVAYSLDSDNFKVPPAGTYHTICQFSSLQGWDISHRLILQAGTLTFEIFVRWILSANRFTSKDY